MKASTATVVLSALAAVASAQPGHAHAKHARHHVEKRDQEVKWFTHWVTATEYVDGPQPTDAAEFYEHHSHSHGHHTTSTSAPAAVDTNTIIPEVVSYVTPTTLATVVVPTSIAAAVTSIAAAVTTVVPVATPVTTAAAAATTAASSSGSSSYSGDITYFTIGLGSCGTNYSGQDYTTNIVAIAAADMGSESNGNPWCGKTITITASNGKTTTALVGDKCPECKSGAIDVSMGTFVELFGSLDLGRGSCTWTVNN